jgi:hypothetical protein
MEDTRLNHIAALVDDARCILADIRDDCDGLPADERIALDGIRKHLNEAICKTKKLKGDLR